MRPRSILAALLLLIAITFSAKANYHYDRAEKPEKGDGSKEKPFVISKWEHLLWLSFSVNTGESFSGKYFIQEGDLDLSATASWDEGEGWMPIGGYYTVGGSLSKMGFSGYYDGKNFTVKGLQINRPKGIYQGLFGYASDGVIQNLKVEGASITATENIGAVVAYIFDAEVSNCHVSQSKIKAIDFYAGGLVGYQSYGKISNCSVHATVEGKEYVGGLVGWSNEGTIEKSRTRGEVSTPLEKEAEHCGGLVGYVNRAKLKWCYSEAKVSGYQKTGGLVGVANKGSIEQCYSHNKEGVAANFFVGGLIGVNEESVVNDSYTLSSVSGKEEVGGFAGYISYSASKITNCYSAGKVTGENAAISAGFSGSKGGGTLVRCFWNRETSGQEKGVGGYDSANVDCKGLTRTEMATEKSFEGWDFSKTWFSATKYNSGFPHLQWFRDNNLGAIEAPERTSPVAIVLHEMDCSVLANEPIAEVIVFTLAGERIGHHVGGGETSLSFPLASGARQFIFQIRFANSGALHIQKGVRH